MKNSFQSNENHLIAIENIQRLYDQIRFYRRALRPVLIPFFMRLQNDQQIETTKIQVKFSRKCCRSRQARFRHTKYVQLCLPRTLIRWDATSH